MIFLKNTKTAQFRFKTKDYEILVMRLLRTQYYKQDYEHINKLK